MSKFARQSASLSPRLTTLVMIVCVLGAAFTLRPALTSVWSSSSTTHTQNVDGNGIPTTVRTPAALPTDLPVHSTSAAVRELVALTGTVIGSLLSPPSPSVPAGTTYT